MVDSRQGELVEARDDDEARGALGQLSVAGDELVGLQLGHDHVFGVDEVVPSVGEREVPRRSPRHAVPEQTDFQRRHALVQEKSVAFVKRARAHLSEQDLESVCSQTIRGDEVVAGWKRHGLRDEAHQGRRVDDESFHRALPSPFGRSNLPWTSAASRLRGRR